MTEPTAEQIERERELAHEIQDALVFPCLSVEHPGSPHDEDCNVLATALARVRIEAEAPFVSAVTGKPGDEMGGYRLLRKDVSMGIFGWWVESLETKASGFISLPNLIAAIRALRGRT